MLICGIKNDKILFVGMMSAKINSNKKADL